MGYYVGRRVGVGWLVAWWVHLCVRACTCVRAPPPLHRSALPRCVPCACVRVSVYQDLSLSLPSPFPFLLPDDDAHAGDRKRARVKQLVACYEYPYLS